MVEGTVRRRRSTFAFWSSNDGGSCRYSASFCVAGGLRVSASREYGERRSTTCLQLDADILKCERVVLAPFQVQLVDVQGIRIEQFHP